MSAALSESLVLRGSIIMPRRLTPLSLVPSLVVPAAARRVEDDGSMDCMITESYDWGEDSPINASNLVISGAERLHVASVNCPVTWRPLAEP